MICKKIKIDYKSGDCVLKARDVKSGDIVEFFITEIERYYEKKCSFGLESKIVGNRFSCDIYLDNGVCEFYKYPKNIIQELCRRLNLNSSEYVFHNNIFTFELTS